MTQERLGGLVLPFVELDFLAKISDEDILKTLLRFQTDDWILVFNILFCLFINYVVLIIVYNHKQLMHGCLVV